MYVAPIEASKLDLLRHATECWRAGGEKHELAFKPKKWRFHVEKPHWGKTDIRWISSADEHTFRTCFEALFRGLRIAELFHFLGADGGLTLFSGFIVARQHSTKSNFHTDFQDTGAKCFTLMTPLYDMSALPDCHLLCVVDAPKAPPGGDGSSSAEDGAEVASSTACGGDDDAHEGIASSLPANDGPATKVDPSTAKQYRYTLGEAVAFGDGFVHATETGASPTPLAFLCFTFGHRHCTEAQWQNAAAYIAEQGPIYQDPWGVLHGPAT